MLTHSRTASFLMTKTLMLLVLIGCCYFPSNTVAQIRRDFSAYPIIEPSAAGQPRTVLSPNQSHPNVAGKKLNPGDYFLLRIIAVNNKDQALQKLFGKGYSYVLYTNTNQFAGISTTQPRVADFVLNKDESPARPGTVPVFGPTIKTSSNDQLFLKLSLRSMQLDASHKSTFEEIVGIVNRSIRETRLFSDFVTSVVNKFAPTGQADVSVDLTLNGLQDGNTWLLFPQDKNEDKNISKELTAANGKYKLLDNVIVDSQNGNKPIKAPIFFIVQVQRSAFDPDAMLAEIQGIGQPPDVPVSPEVQQVLAQTDKDASISQAEEYLFTLLGSRFMALKNNLIVQPMTALSDYLNVLNRLQFRKPDLLNTLITSYTAWFSLPPGHSFQSGKDGQQLLKILLLRLTANDVSFDNTSKKYQLLPVTGGAGRFELLGPPSPNTTDFGKPDAGRTLRIYTMKHLAFLNQGSIYTDREEDQMRSSLKTRFALPDLKTTDPLLTYANRLEDWTNENVTLEVGDNGIFQLRADEIVLRKFRSQLEDLDRSILTNATTTTPTWITAQQNQGVYDAVKTLVDFISKSTDTDQINKVLNELRSKTGRMDRSREAWSEWLATVDPASPSLIYDAKETPRITELSALRRAYLRMKSTHAALQAQNTPANRAAAKNAMRDLYVAYKKSPPTGDATRPDFLSITEWNKLHTSGLDPLDKQDTNFINLWLNSAEFSPNDAGLPFFWASDQNTIMLAAFKLITDPQKQNEISPETVTNAIIAYSKYGDQLSPTNRSSFVRKLREMIDTDKLPTDPSAIAPQTFWAGFLSGWVIDSIRATEAGPRITIIPANVA
jgi:hypothetical protein